MLLSACWVLEGVHRGDVVVTRKVIVRREDGGHEALPSPLTPRHAPLTPTATTRRYNEKF